MQFNTVCLIGYGEVGKIFCADLQSKPGVQAIEAWDKKYERQNRPYGNPCKDE